MREGEVGATAVRGALGFGHRLAAITLIPWLLYLAMYVAHIGVPAIALFVVLLGPSHVLATAGLYLDPELRPALRARPWTHIAAPAAVAVTVAVVWALSPRSVAPLLGAAYFLWQTHHYTKQNFGIFAFWCRATDATAPTRADRRLILATDAIGMTAILRSVQLWPSLDGPLRVVGIAALLLGIIAAIRPSDARRTGALLAAVLFYSPALVFSTSLIAAAAIFEATHGAQYHLMVGTAVRRNQRLLVATFAIVVIGSVAARFYYEPVPNGQWWAGLIAGLGVAHFLADAHLWRLRDPDIRAYMRGRFAFL